MDILKIKSPAKLNLYLNVLRRRPDGYHEIETIFEKISLFDIITIRAQNKGIRITTDNPCLPTDRKNLIYKAAKLLFDKTGFKRGIWIDVRKNIPISSGLGGGSSNAAMTLLGVNQFYKLGLNRAELIKIGKTLGADVPFFLYDFSFAIGRGRGDEIFPIRHKLNIWHIIILFNFGIPTKAVYDSLNLGLTPMSTNVKMSIFKNDIENLANSLYNKLEEVVLKRNMAIGAMKRHLVKEGAYGALLSGSGSTVFGITKTREEAIAVKKRLHRVARNRCKILVVKTFNART